MFYSGSQFPARYKGGAFIAFHGSWNRAPLPQAPSNVTFQPFAGGKPSGKFEIFAGGFAGKDPLMNPTDARRAPMALRKLRMALFTLPTARTEKSGTCSIAAESKDGSDDEKVGGDCGADVHHGSGRANPGGCASTDDEAWDSR